MTLLSRSWWGRVLSLGDTAPTELWGAVKMWLFGFWLLLPFSTFSTTVSYTDLALLPEWAWGMIFMSVSTGQFLALHDGHRPWRRTAAFWAFLLWIMLGLAFLHSNPAGSGPLVFLIIGVSQGWTYIRLGEPA